MGVVEFCKRRLRVLQILFVWLFLVFGFFGGVGCFGLPGLFRGLTKVYALDDNISVTLEAVLSLALSDTTVNIPVTPSDTGTFSSSSFTATVSSNNSTGYKLLLTDYDTDTNLVHAVTSTATIPTLSSNTTKTSFPSNQWGLSLDDTNYLPTPASNGTAITVKEATTPVSNQASTVYAGAKVTNTTMSGAYTDVVTISLIANPTPTSFNQAYALAGKTKSQAVDNHYYYTMQDMNKSICDLTANEQQTTLVDIRDSKTYTIFKSKAPDSKCWMNQNLDLDLSSSTPLTNVNTDLNSVNSWTPERGTVAPEDLGSAAWTWADNNPYSYDPGNKYYYTSNSTIDDTGYSSIENCIAANPTATDCKYYHAGNHYNWSAAVASNDTSAHTAQYDKAPNSICPRGWRLPQGPTSIDHHSDFEYLLAAHNIKNAGSSTNYLTDGFNKVRTNPLYFVRSGATYDYSQKELGFAGHYWTSTIDSSQYAYSLSFYTTSITGQRAVSQRWLEFAVRCLADNRYLYYLNYHPNGTNVSNLPSKQTAHSTDSTYSFTTSSDIPTRTGYNFLGYATLPDGEVVYQPGATVSVSSTSPTTTLYAKWGDSLGFNNSGITTMQEMTSTICSAASKGTTGLLQDTRDDKVYSILKANDNRCWMTQNLDLDLSTSTTLTNTSTDLNNTDSWTPWSNTIAPGGAWIDDTSKPYSYDLGDIYHYTSNSAADDTQYNSLAACVAANHTVADCQHYHAGTYYNWSASVANNDTSAFVNKYTIMPNSICPKGWRLPQGPLSAGDYSDVEDLLVAHGIKSAGAITYLTNGFNNVRAAPLFLARSGNIWGGSIRDIGAKNLLWYSSVVSSNAAYSLYFNPSNVYTEIEGNGRVAGHSVRCVAR